MTIMVERKNKGASMLVKELLQQLRNVLMDQEKTRWDDSELLDYYNECKRVMSAERIEDKTTATMTLQDDKFTYDTTGILRYISCKDADGVVRPLYPDDGTGDNDGDGIIIQSYNRVYVTDPTIGTSLTFKIVALPLADNLESDVRIGDEEAMKYYILSKAYEKEDDTENFAKSDTFYAKYSKIFEKLIDSASVGYSYQQDQKTKTIFY